MNNYNRKPKKSRAEDILGMIRARQENAIFPKVESDNSKLREFLENLEKPPEFDHSFKIDRPMEELEQTPLYRMGFEAGIIQERERAKHVIDNLLEIYKDPWDE